MSMGFTVVDYAVVVAYIVGIAVFGYVRGGRQKSAHEYFLGKDSIPWWVVCFSIVAAETSTLTFISIPGLAYLTNLNFLQVTVGYLAGRIVVSYLFLPAYYKGELSTAYAFLERRFGVKTRRFASVIFMVTRIAADGVRLFATAIPLQLILNISYPAAIAILALVAFAYTFVGGVRSVIWVDAVQMVVYIGGAIAAGVALILMSGGGVAGAFAPAINAGKLHWINLGFGPGFFQQPYTLVAGVLGGAFLSMASHGTDQLIVQRVLTTKSLKESQKALIGSGVVIILQFALFLLVGLLLYGHYHGASLGELGIDRSDKIFPKFIIEGLPPGISGFIIAGLLAAALSTLAGSMSSLASSGILDLYQPIMMNRTKRFSDLGAARLGTAIAALMLVGAAVFFMTTSQTVVELALSIASFTYGGLLGTFLLGVLMKTPTQEDALAAFVAGILVMVTVISLNIVAWTWFTVIGVAVTMTIGGLLSRLTPRQPSPS
jgi:solute:Na+ symporter, SSS family